MSNPSPQTTPRQSRGPSSVRAEGAKPSLGYKFDPVPQNLLDLVRAGELSPVDSQVLAVLLRFRSRLKFACWCAKSTIAEKVGCSTRTVQRSLGRLAQAGLIAQEVVDVPDPDEPRNRTGWRIVLLWLAPADYKPGPGPSRAGKGSKRGPRKASQGDTSVSPSEVSPETALSLPPETALSPNCAGASNGSDGIEPDGKTPSSSSAKPDDDDDEISVSLPNGEGIGDRVETAIEAVRVCYSEETAAKLAADAGRIGRMIGGRWDLYTAAIYQAKAEVERVEKPLRYAVGIVIKDFAVNGVPPSLSMAMEKIREDAKAYAEYVARREAEEAEEEAKEKARLANAEAKARAETEEAIESVSRAGFGLVLDGELVRFTKAGVPLSSTPAELSFALLQHLRVLKPRIIATLKARGEAGEVAADA